MADTERGIQGQYQVSSNGHWGEHRERYGQEEIDNTTEGWKGRSKEDSAGLEKEEDRMTAGGGGGEKRNTDGVAVGHARKLRGSGTGGCEGRRERNR